MKDPIQTHRARQVAEGTYDVTLHLARGMAGLSLDDAVAVLGAHLYSECDGIRDLADALAVRALREAREEKA